jgi:hypothetical protein
MAARKELRIPDGAMVSIDTGLGFEMDCQLWGLEIVKQLEIDGHDDPRIAQYNKKQVSPNRHVICGCSELNLCFKTRCPSLQAKMKVYNFGHTLHGMRKVRLQTTIGKKVNRGSPVKRDAAPKCR